MSKYIFILFIGGCIASFYFLQNDDSGNTNEIHRAVNFNNFEWSILEDLDPVYSPFYENKFKSFYYFKLINNMIFMTRIDEKTGQLIFEKAVLEKPKFLNKFIKPIIYSNNLILNFDNFIYIISLENGQIINKFDLGCNVDRCDLIGGILTTSCYSGENLNEYNYYRILIINNDIRVEKIYNYSIKNGNAFVSWAPILDQNNTWLMPTLNYEKKSGLTENKLAFIQNHKLIKEEVYCWQNDNGYGQSENFIIDDNLIYIRCLNVIYCYNKETMTLLWSTEFERESFSSNLIIDSCFLYFASEDNNFYVIDKKTGKIELNLKSASTCSLLNDNGKYISFVGGSDGYVYIYDKLNFKYLSIYRSYTGRNYNKLFAIGNNSLFLHDGSKWICKNISDFYNDSTSNL